MLFRTLRRIRAFERDAMPCVLTMQDRDIILALGSAQEQGRYLGLKQLTLLNLGSLATLRRRLSRMVRLGCIEKTVHKNDRRAIQFVVAKRFWKHFDRVRQVLRSIAYQIVMDEAGMRDKANSTVIGTAKDCNEAVGLLRATIERHCTIKRIQISCLHNPTWTLFAMIDVEGNAQSAAMEINGQVFGYDLVCAYLPTPAGFQCDKAPKGATCLGESR